MKDLHYHKSQASCVKCVKSEAISILHYFFTAHFPQTIFGQHMVLLEGHKRLE